MVNILKERYVNCDIKINCLNKFKDIKGWLKYLHVNKTLVFEPRFYTKDPDMDLLYGTFFNVYSKNYNMKNSKDGNFTKSDWECLTVHSLDCLHYNGINKVDTFQGIVLNKNCVTEYIFIDLIQYYLILNDLYVYNREVYLRVKDYSISYVKSGTVKDLLYEKFQENIIPYFIKNFPCQFIGFDFYFLIKTFKNKMQDNILKIQNLTTNKINLDFNYMEFSDGVYDIKNNKFFAKNSLHLMSICTIKYYYKTYQSVRKNKPDV